MLPKHIELHLLILARLCLLILVHLILLRLARQEKLILPQDKVQQVNIKKWQHPENGL